MEDIVLPAVPKAIMGRPKKIEPKIIDEFSPEELCDRLAECGGDVSEFCKSFHADKSSYQKLVARALFTLNTPGNEDQLQKWQLLVYCHRQAITAIKEQQALDFIRDVETPKPKEGEDKVMAFKDLVPYLNFWLSDYKEGAKGRARQATTKGGDQVTAEVEAMLARMREHASPQTDEEEEI